MKHADFRPSRPGSKESRVRLPSPKNKTPEMQQAASRPADRKDSSVRPNSRVETPVKQPRLKLRRYVSEGVAAPEVQYVVEPIDNALQEDCLMKTNSKVTVPFPLDEYEEDLEKVVHIKLHASKDHTRSKEARTLPKEEPPKPVHVPQHRLKLSHCKSEAVLQTVDDVFGASASTTADEGTLEESTKRKSEKLMKVFDLENIREKEPHLEHQSAEHYRSTPRMGEQQPPS